MVWEFEWVCPWGLFPCLHKLVSQILNEQVPKANNCDYEIMAEYIAKHEDLDSLVMQSGIV